MPIGRIGDFGKEDEGKDQFSQSGTSSGTSVMRGPSDIDAIIANARAQSMQSAAPNVCNITLYRNGFVVGQGGFRSLRDPQNAEFVDALKNGFVFNFFSSKDMFLQNLKKKLEHSLVLKFNRLE